MIHFNLKLLQQNILDWIRLLIISKSIIYDCICRVQMYWTIKDSHAGLLNLRSVSYKNPETLTLSTFPELVCASHKVLVCYSKTKRLSVQRDVQGTASESSGLPKSEAVLMTIVSFLYLLIILSKLKVGKDPYIVWVCMIIPASLFRASRSQDCLFSVWISICCSQHESPKLSMLRMF